MSTSFHDQFTILRSYPEYFFSDCSFSPTLEWGFFFVLAIGLLIPNAPPISPAIVTGHGIAKMGRLRGGLCAGSSPTPGAGLACRVSALLSQASVRLLWHPLLSSRWARVRVRTSLIMSVVSCCELSLRLVSERLLCSVSYFFPLLQALVM